VFIAIISVSFGCTNQNEALREEYREFFTTLIEYRNQIVEGKLQNDTPDHRKFARFLAEAETTIQNSGPKNITDPLNPDSSEAQLMVEKSYLIDLFRKAYVLLDELPEDKASLEEFDKAAEDFAGTYGISIKLTPT
jgi:hypothetical protein